MSDKFSLPKYIPELDGLRAVGILAVIMVHWNPLGHHYNEVLPFVTRFPRLGWVGVDLFFTISGFLITGILLSTKGKEGYFKNFMARRALRIFPVYYLLLFLVWVVFPLLPDFYEYVFSSDTPIGVVSYWLYFSNIMMGYGPAKHELLQITWSLSIEEQFYLVFPLFVYRYTPRTLAKIAIGILIAGPILRAFCLFYLGNSANSIQFLTPLKLDSICYGILLRIWLESMSVDQFRKYQKLAVRLLPLIPLGLLAMLYLQESQTADGKRLVGQNPWNIVIGFSFLGFGSALLILASLGENKKFWLNRFLTQKYMINIGIISYGIYLYHETVEVMLSDYLVGVLGFEEPSLIMKFCFFIPVSFVLTMTIATLSWRYFEKPILQYKKLFQTPK